MTETESISADNGLQATEIMTDGWESRVITDVADNNDKYERDTDPLF